MDNTYIIFTSVNEEEFFARFNDGSFIRFYGGHGPAIAFGNGTESIYMNKEEHMEWFASDRVGRTTYETLGDKYSKDWRFFRHMDNAFKSAVNLPEFHSWTWE